ncbi:glycosyltransferase family 4 protein [Guyparkeria hydrothermalis]|uniref:glycosyltransferase family 4 protein n=1 Tax=Guyparkeria hydrothermalis TaxID=923 RepID=UPI002021EFEA|nr:glycosyltransferase family 4 protein [Guyparkeria hydrothermalis]MCL7743687.1 glycosyltransferase family 4 protein [Guyparkeria hydrothermalis]
MKVLLLSRYGPMGASSRVRYLQYLPYLRSHGMDVSVVPLFSDAYLRSLYEGRARWRDVIAGYMRRVRALLQARRFDAVIIEKELFPFLPAFAERLLRAAGVPYVVDYDDALFHRYDLHSSKLVRGVLGRKIDVVMRDAAVVVAGNDYLADRARGAGASSVELIPTVVDTERYQPRQTPPNETPVIGWIGTPKTSRYLQPLLPVFEALQARMPVRVVAVGARPEDFAGTPVETRPWSEETEVQSIQQFDIGIMPLTDSSWERGKCGYKLIQYMACGVPVVASPVGVNSVIVKPGENGLLACDDEWEKQLTTLIQDAELRRSFGSRGRKDVEDWYSLEVQAPRLLEVLSSTRPSKPDSQKALKND